MAHYSKVNVYKTTLQDHVWRQNCKCGSMIYLGSYYINLQLCNVLVNA